MMIWVSGTYMARHHLEPGYPEKIAKGGKSFPCKFQGNLIRFLMDMLITSLIYFQFLPNKAVIQCVLSYQLSLRYVINHFVLLIKAPHNLNTWDFCCRSDTPTSKYHKIRSELTRRNTVSTMYDELIANADKSDSEQGKILLSRTFLTNNSRTY